MFHPRGWDLARRSCTSDVLCTASRQRCSSRKAQDISCAPHPRMTKRSLSSGPNFYHNRILEQYAARETRRVTLRQLTVFGRTLSEEKLLKSANYVRAELPVRLAHRIADFQHLPFVVGTNPHIEFIYHLYWAAFEMFRAIKPIETLEQNREFCETVEIMLDRHLVAIPRLAMGIAESSEHLQPREADRFMNEMLRSRIGRRVLAEQHIKLSAVFDGHEHQEESFIGIVNTKCRAEDVVRKCAALAGKIFEDGLGIQPPEVVVDGFLDATFTYIPDQIEYIVFELLKNSMWATIEKHAPH
ncbi:branched-chain alpha-ketoacid dehydrogenase, partial [Fimicolochytrium jonesii]|uniref:branched-chain alpha-ketoacid dehydrogenase n=1 Tax=Fimicolochytrium jonesii TaxID=1396493 RepID=UPI0022FED015